MKMSLATLGLKNHIQLDFKVGGVNRFTSSDLKTASSWGGENSDSQDRATSDYSRDLNEEKNRID